MSKKPRSPKTSNKGLQGVLQKELADLDQTLAGLAEREERLHDELRSIRMERAQKQELREHALALLEHTQQTPSTNRLTASTKTGMAGLSDMVDAPEKYQLGRKAKISDTLAQAVYETLKGTEPEEGKPGDPMHYRDLVAALEGRRVYISGRDPGLNLVAHIHKDSRFVRPLRGMYALKEWYPEVPINVGGRANKKT